MSSPLQLNEVLDAIEILPDAERGEVLRRIKADGGVTPEYAQRIAHLIDEQVRREAEGALPEQLQELEAAHGELQSAALALPAEEAGQELQDELATQQDAYDEWFAGVDGIMRRSARFAEQSRKADETKQADAIRKMLHEQERNPQGPKLN